MTVVYLDDWRTPRCGDRVYDETAPHHVGVVRAVLVDDLLIVIDWKDRDDGIVKSYVPACFVRRYREGRS